MPVAIHPFVVLGRFFVQRVAAFVPTATADPAGTANHPKLFVTVDREQQLQPVDGISIQQPSSHQNPAAGRPPPTERHPHRQPQHGQELGESAAVGVARHDDAATNVRAALVTVDARPLCFFICSLRSAPSFAASFGFLACRS